MTPTLAVYLGETIDTATEAISEALESFPTEHDPHAPVARLVSLGTLQRLWDADTVDYGRADLSIPVWIVGVLGHGLSLSEVLYMPGIGGGTVADDTPVDGIFVAWEANTSGLVTTGALISTTHQSYESLVALPDEDLPIAPVAVQPPWYPDR